MLIGRKATDFAAGKSASALTGLISRTSRCNSETRNHSKAQFPRPPRSSGGGGCVSRGELMRFIRRLAFIFGARFAVHPDGALYVRIADKWGQA